MTKFFFVKHLVGNSKRNGTPYNIIELSDGLTSEIVPTTIDKADTEPIEKGTEVTPVVSLGENFRPVITDLNY